jgi:chemotaxis protein CheY-P-specific phosphatase CheC
MSREALVVGINFYKKITGFNSLNIPSEDAAEIARILAEEGDFSVTQLPEAVKDGEIRLDSKAG